MERQRYEEALRAAEAAGPSYEGRLPVHSIVDIGQKYMDTLFEEGKHRSLVSMEVLWSNQLKMSYRSVR